jgi:hypothetical protein
VGRTDDEIAVGGTLDLARRSGLIFESAGHCAVAADLFSVDCGEFQLLVRWWSKSGYCG